MNISALGRCIDQPLFLNRLQKKMPALLVTAGAGYGFYDTYKASGGKDFEFKKKRLLKNLIIISAAAGASLAGANGLKIFGKRIIPALIETTPREIIQQRQNKAIKNFLTNVKIEDKNLSDILHKAKSKVLSVKEVRYLMKNIPEGKNKNFLFNVILPEAENLNSKGIFNEIKRLSMLGAIPVMGGICGGILADGATKNLTKKNTADKIKEGFYQYFANIFLCNVGACGALFAAEGLQKANVIKPLSPLKKMAVIMTGITATGIIGGSWIANKMSQKFIDPLFSSQKSKHPTHKGVYDERKPELADIALHADDIATAGVLSGFKWIEPALPLMYFVSGYRAGIGYRNNGKQKH